MENIELGNGYEDLFSRVEKMCNIVYQTLGKGYQESVYQHALCVELEKGQIYHEIEVEMDVMYDNKKVGSIRADIVCYDDHPLIIETKTVYRLQFKDRLQVGRYMKTIGIPYGILVNFSLIRDRPEIEFLVMMEDGITIYDRRYKKGLSIYR